MTSFSTSREIRAGVEQVFASRVEHIVVPANEQNLDRLSLEVLRQTGGSGQ